MTKMLNDWIALTKENPIEADMPIIDPHHHLWDDFPLHGLPEHYLLDDFMADIGGGHNITKTVFVECTTGYRQEGPEEMRPVGETEFANQIATLSESGRYGDTAVAAGMVSFADLSLGTAVEPVLEAHIAAGCQRVRGIRHATAWDGSRKSYMNSPRGLMLDARFRAGFACLHKHNLSYDAWLYFTQLPELVDLARTFHDTTIILDHVGGILGEEGPYADKRAEVFDIWKLGISELATCANVFVKLGGLAMPISGFGWEKAEKPPTSKELATTTANYYLFCIEQFGVHRCMFESNFPVDKLPLRDSDYTRLVTNSLDTTVAVSANTYDWIIITSEAVEDYANKVGVFRFDQQFELDYKPKGVSNHYPVFAAFSVGNDTN